MPFDTCSISSEDYVLNLDNVIVTEDSFCSSLFLQYLKNFHSSARLSHNDQYEGIHTYVFPITSFSNLLDCSSLVSWDGMEEIGVLFFWKAGINGFSRM